MATWGLHMRIAEGLLSQNKHLDETYFLIGNIGPDCGMPNADWSEFTPSTEISHWKSDEGDIQADVFYATHLKGEVSSVPEYSFLMGYYVHLLTDIAFSRLVNHKKMTCKLYEPWHQDPKFIWTIKKDWYDLDHKYFRDHPHNIFHRIFKHVKGFPDVLTYYPKGAVQSRIDYISHFYSNPPLELDREYIYLSEHEMACFIEETIREVQVYMNQSKKNNISQHEA